MLVQFEQPYAACPLCGASSLNPAFSLKISDQLLSWQRCGICDLTFQNPRLTVDSIHRLYLATDYWGEGRSTADGVPPTSAYTHYTAFDSLRMRHAHRRLARIGKVTGLQGGRLLDVGAATGFTGVAARERGFGVTCVEPDRGMAEYGMNHYGLRYHVGDLESCPLEEEAYDLVTLLGTDSHFHHPLHSFQYLARFLKRGGYLAMTYQDYTHPIRRLFPSLKQSWNVIYNLSDRSFAELMERLGMEVVYQQPHEWYVVPLSHIFLLLHIPMPPWVQKSSWLAVPAASLSFRLVVARRR